MAEENREERSAVLEPPAPESTGNATTERVVGIVLGRLVALHAPDLALVALKGDLSAPPVLARRLAGLTSEDQGREVALMFEEGDPARPMIIGRVEDAPGARVPKRPIEIDADSIVLNGGKEIVLRCGDATLTLKRDGKLILRGAYVETQATGVNRIKGGSVKIN